MATKLWYVAMSEVLIVRSFGICWYFGGVVVIAGLARYQTHAQQVSGIPQLPKCGTEAWEWLRHFGMLVRGVVCMFGYSWYLLVFPSLLVVLGLLVRIAYTSVSAPTSTFASASKSAFTTTSQSVPLPSTGSSLFANVLCLRLLPLPLPPVSWL